jgi:calcineurin-like phosphoesterase family protein
MKIWFTADLHFGHRNVIPYCKRPYKNVETMARVFASTWNGLVHPRDHVYVLGDAAWGNRPEIPWLTGKKFLIPGNHDEWKVGDFAQQGWEGLPIAHKFRHDRVRYVLSHHPFEVPLRWGKGETIHLHGHSHGNGEKKLGRLDVGIDNAYKLLGDYRPFTLEEALKFARED